MNYQKIAVSQIDALWDIQRCYKNEIGEKEPENREKEQLMKAINENKINFYGVWKNEKLIGCCSITAGFSTFNYKDSGVFEDFYILPLYRHQGIARELVKYAYNESGVASLSVGCADCDIKMYQSLGFSIPIGNLLVMNSSF